MWPRSDLPAAARASGRLDAVVDRVAQQVQQRIGHVLEQPFVEGDVLAADREVDRLCRSSPR